MLRMSTSARRTATGFGSAFAMAIALAGGAAVVTAATAAPAAAQRGRSNAARNLILTLGNKLKDAQLQRQGLEMMVASGKVDPAQLGQFQFFIGSLAYDARDWAAARTALQAAAAAGYAGEGNPEAMIAETYFGENQAVQGLDYLKGIVERKVAAGQ